MLLLRKLAVTFRFFAAAATSSYRRSKVTRESPPDPETSLSIQFRERPDSKRDLERSKYRIPVILWKPTLEAETSPSRVPPPTFACIHRPVKFTWPEIRAPRITGIFAPVQAK